MLKKIKKIVFKKMNKMKTMPNIFIYSGKTNKDKNVANKKIHDTNQFA